ncbi:IclR family transcriptional regulator [Streptomyces halobius]|uniref:Helix-turn-helix domain-containing protein n=1 Tax=Streptomyces halobius TaxID=2879846 RepID=A0ABY4MAM3_9ACTN|nr:IclR family transcriptional regulator C-terminal domain-containing protein [Streptomyces halobius]UQA93406.1 helix-turn-helix domain-containing protein [Streptomyces halobius]
MPQSVDRALDLLDAVAEAPGPVTAKALARRLDCGLSTVYALLGALTDRGHLTRTPDGYTLGYRLPSLHRAFQRQLRIDGRVHEALLRLRGVSGADVFFSTYRDGEIAVLDGATAAAGSVFSVGRDSAAHATAHGKALLASLPGAARRRYLATTGMAPRTARTITSPERLERELRRVRRDGVAVEEGEAASGMACVAVPVRMPVRAGGPAPALTAVSAALPLAEFARLRGPLTEALRREAAALR